MTTLVCDAVAPRPSGPAERWLRAFEVGSSLLAIVAVIGWTVAHATAPDERDYDSAASAAVGSAVGDVPRGRETALGFYGGVPHTLASDVAIKKSGVHDFALQGVQWEGKPFVNPIYYGVRTTRWLTARSGVMLDFTHSKAISKRDIPYNFEGTLKGEPAPTTGTVEEHFGKLEASHGHNMLTLNGLLRLPGFARLWPYVGMGAGISLPHMEVNLKDEPRTYEYQYAGPVGQALAGIELRLPRVSLFLEYKFSLAPYEVPLSGNNSKDFLPQDLWRQFQAWLGGAEPPQGRLSTNFVSHDVIGGFAIRFAPAPP